MQHDITPCAAGDYTLLYPAQAPDYGAMPVFAPFDERVIDYLNEVSRSILSDRGARMYPDVVTFAYFCRRSNIMALREKYTTAGQLRLGRGLVLHIAPSNVPVNFAYSFVSAMLAGDSSVVRVSAKDFPQIDMIVRHLRKVADSGSHAEAAGALAIVRYAHEAAAGAYFSSIAAARVIWGGDTTIAAIRRLPSAPRTIDVCFADRYSIAMLGSDAVADATDDELRRLAEGFYNDTYLFDQNACSAPHLVLWLGRGAASRAKARFWDAVHSVASSRYTLQPVLAVDKLTALYSQAVRMDVRQEPMPDNLVVRCDLETLPEDMESFRCAGGYFSEMTIDSPDEILHAVSPRYQTLAYYGIQPDYIRSFMAGRLPRGIDRVVPVGHTTDFSLTWDGYNLIDTLSRIIEVI